MIVKKKKGFMLTLPALPWLIIIVFAIILVVALLAIVKTASLISSDANRVSSNALQTLLNSNDCTPNTKLPFKDVLGIGLGAEVYDEVCPDEAICISDATVAINYGNKVDVVVLGDCFTKSDFVMPPNYVFYVEYAGCPLVNNMFLSTNACYFHRNSIHSSIFAKTVSVEYIALPNGDVARVVLIVGG